MAETKLLGNVHIMTHWQDAACRLDAMVGYDHGPVVERGIFEKYVLDETHVHFGVDDVAGLLIVGERHLALKHYQRACLRLAHAHAGIDHGHDASMLTVVVFLLMFEKTPEIAELTMAADVDEKSLYLILKKYHKNYQTDTHELIKNRAREPEIENFRSEHPYGKKHQHAVEERERAAVFHHPVDIEKQQGDYQDVDYVFYSY